MITFPRAKINIGLRITGKREDGFHDIETIFYPVCLSDALEFRVRTDGKKMDTIVMAGVSEQVPFESNLVIKALNSIRESADIPPLEIILLKGIPSGAGLGGGSSDASSMLKTLNRYFSLGLEMKILEEKASRLGSDCTFFVRSEPSLAKGRGELLTPVNKLDETLWLVLVKPEINISTAEAYSGCRPYRDGSDLSAVYSSGIDNWKDSMKNDFEETIFPLHPGLADIKKALYDAGAVYASMSGSGSTIYGIYRGKPSISPGLKNYIIYSGLL
ncbi:MAG: 4-(cytidine 5'-diphospho)-2-C-methyl-D-erythritol kinase [Bacteroidales bacterium]